MSDAAVESDALSAYLGRAISAHKSRSVSAVNLFQILLRSAMFASDAGAAITIYNAMPLRRDTDALRVARTLCRRHHVTLAIRIAQSAVDVNDVPREHELLNAIMLAATEFLAALESLDARELRRGRYVDYEEWIVRALNAVTRECERREEDAVVYREVLSRCRSSLVRFYYYRNDIVLLLQRNTAEASLDTKLHVYAGTVVALCKEPNKWPRALQVADELVLLLPANVATGDAQTVRSPIQTDCVRRAVTALMLTAKSDDDKERAWSILQGANIAPTSRCYDALLIAFAPTMIRPRIERSSVYRLRIAVQPKSDVVETIEERMRQYDRFAAAVSFVVNDMAARNVTPAPFLVTQLFSAVTLTLPSWKKTADFAQREHQRMHIGLSKLVQTCIALGVHPTAAAIHSAVVQTCNRYGPLQALTLIENFEALHIDVIDSVHALTIAARKWCSDINSTWFPPHERRPTLERILNKIQSAPPSQATPLSYRKLLRMAARIKDDGTLTTAIFDALATTLIPNTQDAHDALKAIALANADIISAFYWKHHQTPALFDADALSIIISALAQRRSADAFAVYEQCKERRGGALSVSVFRELITLCQLLSRTSQVSQLLSDAERSGVDTRTLRDQLHLEYDWRGRNVTQHKQKRRTRDVNHV